MVPNMAINYDLLKWNIWCTKVRCDFWFLYRANLYH